MTINSTNLPQFIKNVRLYVILYVEIIKFIYKIGGKNEYIY